VSTTLAPIAPGTYADADLELDLRWWAAANYLTVAQIYLQDNALMRDPLTVEHIKPRLLGHWGTSPGLSMIYTLLNRLIRDTGTDCVCLAGPGHGGPALVANAYLDGTYSEIYPRISRDASGVARLVRQFSTPGGIPSHVSVQTPGSIHEGGELGYALAHAGGAVFDHPDLLVAAVIGDGEAETGPLAASWKLPAFLNPRRDGAVLPILHLNGYKISGPTLLGRTDDAQVCALLSSQGWDPVMVAGDDPAIVFPQLYAALERTPTGRSPHCSTRPEPPQMRCPGQHGGRPSCSVLPRGGLAPTSSTSPGPRHLPRPPSTPRPGAGKPRTPADARAVAALLPPRRALRRRWRPDAGAGRVGANR